MVMRAHSYGCGAEDASSSSTSDGQPDNIRVNPGRARSGSALCAIIMRFTARFRELDTPSTRCTACKPPYVSFNGALSAFPDCIRNLPLHDPVRCDRICLPGTDLPAACVDLCKPHPGRKIPSGRGA